MVTKNYFRVHKTKTEFNKDKRIVNTPPLPCPIKHVGFYRRRVNAKLPWPCNTSSVIIAAFCCEQGDNPKTHCHYSPNSHLCCWLGTPAQGRGLPMAAGYCPRPTFPLHLGRECCGAVRSQTLKPRDAVLSSRAEQTSLSKGLEDHLHA